MSVHNVRLLRYARQKNAHLPHVNSAFFDFASLASEHSDSDTDFIDGLYLWFGKVISKAALKVCGLEIVGVCDIDIEHLQENAEEFEKLRGTKPRTFKYCQG